MKKKDKKKLIKTNIILGIFLLLTGIILESKATLNIMFNPAYSGMNLNIKEVDISYDKEEKQTKQTAPQPMAIAYQPDTSWGWPTTTNYRITSSYNNRHPAIDIISTDGNLNIYAASSGVIVTDSYKWDGGNYLILKQDNGYYTLYCHLAQKLVTTGQRVNKGDVIGIMGTTGLSTGVHLHYSVWNGYPYYGSSHINPWSFY